MTSPRSDDFSMRQQIDKIYRLLVGNGDVGLCEQVRDNRRELGDLTETVSSLAKSVQTVVDEQKAHREWHAQPEHWTIQETLRRPGILFVIGLVVVSLMVIAASVGIPEATALIKGLLP